MAALALVLGALPLAAAPKPKEELGAQARLIAALEAQLGELAVEPGTAFRFGELRAILAKMKELTGAESLLREDLRGIENEIRGYCGRNDAYREEYLRWVRLAAVGENHPELVTASGRRYVEVVVRRVTEVGLEIRHLDGSARLRHQVLPAEFQERFQWDPVAARASLEKEAALSSRAGRRAWVEARRAEIAAQTRAERAASRAWRAARGGGEEPVPFESRLHSPDPIEPLQIDSPDPIEPLAVHSPDPIEPLTIDSPGPVEPGELHSPDPVQPLQVHSPGEVEPRKIHSPVSIRPLRLHSSDRVRLRKLHSSRGISRLRLQPSGKLH